MKRWPQERPRCVQRNCGRELRPDYVVIQDSEPVQRCGYVYLSTGRLCDRVEDEHQRIAAIGWQPWQGTPHDFDPGRIVNVATGRRVTDEVRSFGVANLFCSNECAIIEAIRLYAGEAGRRKDELRDLNDRRPSLVEAREEASAFQQQVVAAEGRQEG